MDFPGGYGIAVMCLVQLYFVCDFGENVQVKSSMIVTLRKKIINVRLHFPGFKNHQNNGLSEVLYSNNWYILPTICQKAILLLIHRQQNGIRITEGPFRTINRKLFQIVIFKVNIWWWGAFIYRMNSIHFRFWTKFTVLSCSWLTSLGKLTMEWTLSDAILFILMNTFGV